MLFWLAIIIIIYFLGRYLKTRCNKRNKIKKFSSNFYKDFFINPIVHLEFSKEILEQFKNDENIHKFSPHKLNKEYVASYSDVTNLKKRIYLISWDEFQNIDLNGVLFYLVNKKEVANHIRIIENELNNNCPMGEIMNKVGGNYFIQITYPELEKLYFKKDKIN